uniref:Uncharacterized protein n=1 Tax=uncultured marine crenarchaeote HF4000_APKG10I20 TaxID=455612 RepID=B3TCA7_9ARCH|nr:hypothetical protein ALOHA_HF4000APKG10I20ctg7g3 [uncultured marine crenarchaeote HF4000_APKG10I20]
MVLQKVAPLKLAPLTSAPCRVAPLKFALLRLASFRNAPNSSALLRLAPLRFIPFMTAFSKVVLLKSARSGLHFPNHIFYKSLYSAIDSHLPTEAQTLTCTFEQPTGLQKSNII